MNRYPLWKTLMILLVLVWGFFYTLPNFYGEVPAVQISSAKSTLKLDAATLSAELEKVLSQNNLQHTGLFTDATSIRFRFADTDLQLRARDLIETRLNPEPDNPSYIVALNLLSASPNWLTAINALPMYLGLDLRGGVHFLLEVDMAGAITKRLDSSAGDFRTLMRSKRIRHGGIRRVGEAIEIRARDAETAQKITDAIRAADETDFTLTQTQDGGHIRLSAALNDAAKQAIRESAIKQNITTLHNRINELGVAEPVIQQQGAERIVVQLPGVQDVAKAKDILGRTATLEIRMVDSTPGALEAALDGRVPPGSELYNGREGYPILVKNQVELTGDRLNDAQPGFDSRNNEPAVHLNLDPAGARIFRDLTRENRGQRMAILLIEKGRGEVVTAPSINEEIPGGRVQISGAMTTTEAHDIALLLRAGSLAAPMQIIEERTVGPSLGAENISKGFHSTLWGFAVIAVFMVVYYLIFGLASIIALSANLMLLIALLSLLQATLTLPGIAAVALTLGMAIDANVLINERIREEIRNGATPQAAITAGYDRAFDTILDSNITTLIAGLALLAFGTGPVRGFAVVHCIGILTSMFSAILVSRLIINQIYGNRRVSKLSIG